MRLAETLLRRLPPELAHAAALRALSLGLGRGGRIDDGPGATLFGKPVRNRIGLSGGADKEAAALAGWGRLGFGFVEAGTVTLEARAGNPRPRVWRVGDEAMVNAMGLPNRGLDRFVGNLTKFRATPGGRAACVGASVATPAGRPRELAEIGAAVAGLVDFATLNVSCPNTEHERPALDAALAQIAALRDGLGRVPVLVKLGPTGAPAALDEMVDAFGAAGVAGFVACNTAPAALRGLLGHHAPAPWPERDHAAVGGYSGPGLAGISLWMVERIRERAGPGPTVVGVGGVQRPGDLDAMMAAGADAVAVYTAVARRGVAALDDLRRADAASRAGRPLPAAGSPRAARA